MARDNNAVNLQVSQAIATYGTNNVAVLAMTYGEITGIMTAAIPFEPLGLVKWYGCDGNAQLKAVISDNTLAVFALKTRFIAPIMGLGDATYIMGLAFLNVGSADMGRITEMIPLVCKSYAQMGISRKLNANNDLNEADYLFWKMLSCQNGYYWISLPLI